MWNGRFWKFLYLFSMMVLILAVVRERGIARDAHRSWQAYQAQLSRARAVDETIGRTLPDAEVTALDGGSSLLVKLGTYRPVWILDSEACPSCLDQVGRWNASLEAAHRPPALVLVGVDLDHARQIRDALGVRFPVYTAVNGLREALQLRLPSTYLYLDEHDTVLLADAHSSHTSCEWSFPAHAAAIAAQT